jgi:serine protease AprX
MHLFRSLVLSVALLAALMVPTGSPPAASAPETSLSDVVAGFLDDATPGARMDVIVSFHDRSGLDRLRPIAPQMGRTRALPMALANLTAAQIVDVASWPETRSLWDNAELELYLDDSVGMVKADQVWAGEGLATGYDGTGVGVAVLDTGIDATHPDLQPYGEKLRENFIVVTNPLDEGPAAYIPAPVPDDEYGHGTHVAGTVGGTGAASDGLYTGVAPGADLYGFKIGSANVLTWFAIASYDWVLTEGQEVDNPIRVVSNSWGGGGGSDFNPDDPVDIASKAAYDAGVVTVFAAGNAGSPNTLGRNSTSPYVVTVGAADKDFALAPFSSTGRPSGDLVRDDNGIYRPTVIAPGVDIIAARSLTGAVMSDALLLDNPFYTVASGTSMATPHVSGIVALMLEANPDLTPQNVIDILECSATPMDGYHAFEVGAGFVDALAAVQMAEAGQTRCTLSLNDAPFQACFEGGEFEGAALPAGYALWEQGDASLATLHEIEVPAGVDALYASMDWTVPVENIYMFLLDPDGNEVASSAGLLDVPINERAVLTTSPVAGTWTLAVVGRINLVTPYSGWFTLYCQITDEQCEPERTRETDVFEDTIQFGLPTGDIITETGDAKYFEVEVGDSVENVGFTLEWEDPAQDLDMYIYGPDGTRVASAASENHPEATSVAA